ncbi:hypothetical protein BSPWISOXPB_3072 [uncultured Gammaproteobacteria bacterium]|nr:hypothetical protein BSPWISOXPB_3072 [uncultured Gammaproteobacteria bacterium]
MRIHFMRDTIDIICIVITFLIIEYNLIQKFNIRF